ncbi:thrombospondin-4-like [Anneissia japonica]|uniref:thrombospondin-4-like n=1 Tax=Anneissia japonica TaxID=1529436 RepID=UPI001425B3A6|nr:thrombospondin-4-like [Anneissia japonica]
MKNIPTEPDFSYFFYKIELQSNFNLLYRFKNVCEFAVLPGVECVDVDRDTADPLATLFICQTCPPGYFGDGVTCSCLDSRTCEDFPCFPVVECVDVDRDPADPFANLFICQSCPPFYVGDGVACSKYTCADSPCFPGVECVDVDRDPADLFAKLFVCQTCPQGYYGDGVDCFFTVKFVKIVLLLIYNSYN